MVILRRSQRDIDAQAPVGLRDAPSRSRLGHSTMRCCGSSAAGAPPAEQSPAAMRHTLAESYPLRILLAEDNLVNRKLALRLLQRLVTRRMSPRMVSRLSAWCVHGVTTLC